VSNPMVQLQEATIKAQCKTLRMPMVASQFGTLAEQAIRERQSHIGYLEALLLAEIEERERNTIERRIREAHLPRVKTLQEFDYTQSPNVTAAKMRDLAEGGYIDSGRTRPFYRRMRHRQDPSAHWTLRGSLPAEAPGTIYHRGRSGQRTGRG
jgi:crotonobetainyl-CoA:carnitine CoA-transferase CaiB-like acyl-CoA transferase